LQPMTKLPSGWNAKRVRRVLAHYERQTDSEAVAEDEAAYDDGGPTMMMAVPRELVPEVRELIARNAVRSAGRRGRRSKSTSRRRSTTPSDPTLESLVRGITKRNRHATQWD
jgi:hypothetical protein